MKIHEAAALAGITVRTLHYYDEIGLLNPSGVTDAGYRLYNDEDLERLQQILFFRELDFPLQTIKEILADPLFDKEETLRRHRQLLTKKRDRLNRLIDLVDRTMKGDTPMSFEEFDTTDIEAAKQRYAAEVKERWGDTAAYAESEKRTAGYDDRQWAAIREESTALLRAFSEERQGDSAGASAQTLVKRWQEHICAHFYPCTKEILAGLGQMYVGDERFTQSIDQYGAGTAAFMAQAIAVYCASR